MIPDLVVCKTPKLRLKTHSHIPFCVSLNMQFEYERKFTRMLSLVLSFRT